MSGKMFFKEDTQWETIKNKWENMFVEQCKKLTDSMPKRIILLKISNDKTIPYLRLNISTNWMSCFVFFLC